MEFLENQMSDAPEEIEKAWAAGLEESKKRRAQYLLYK
jgi:hypothetical protein